MRIIDADKFEAFVIRTNGDEEFVNGVQYVLERIDNAPTVEAIPKADYENRLKTDMVAMLEDLKQDIIAEAYGIEMDCTDYVVNVADIDKVIQQKINALKAEIEPQESEDKEAAGQ